MNARLFEAVQARNRVSYRPLGSRLRAKLDLNLAAELKDNR